MPASPFGVFSIATASGTAGEPAAVGRPGAFQSGADHLFVKKQAAAQAVADEELSYPQNLPPAHFIRRAVKGVTGPAKKFSTRSTREGVCADDGSIVLHSWDKSGKERPRCDVECKNCSKLLSITFDGSLGGLDKLEAEVEKAHQLGYQEFYQGTTSLADSPCVRPFEEMFSSPHGAFARELLRQSAS